MGPYHASAPRPPALGEGATRPRLHRFRALAVCALALLACGEPPPPPIPFAPGATGPARRLLLIGLDGANWEILRPLLDTGRVPHLAGLIAAGTASILWSEEPTVTPAVWTTILTGRSRDAHGIEGFTGRDPRTGAVVPARSSMRRTPALWTYLGQLGRTVGIAGAYVTWPAEPVHGFLVSRRVAEPGFTHTTWPAALAARVGDGDPATFDALFVEPGFLGDAETDFRTGFLRRSWITDHAAFALGLEALGPEPPDFVFVYFHLPDTAQHVFWPPGEEPEASRAFEPILRAYEHVDGRIGALLDRVAAPGTAVMVVSDHGAAGTGVAVLFERHSDVLLAALGLLEFERSPTGEPRVDMRRSLFVPGPESAAMVQFWVNRQHPRLADRPDLRTQLASRAMSQLGDLRFDGSGRPFFRFVERSANDPDAIVAELGITAEEVDDTVTIGGRTLRVADLYRPAPFGGGHTDRGVLIAAGPPFRVGLDRVPAHPEDHDSPPESGALGVLDVAPTVLAALDLPVPAALEGHVMREILRGDFVRGRDFTPRAVELDWKPYEPAGMEDELALPDENLKMLRALGYAQ